MRAPAHSHISIQTFDCSSNNMTASQGTSAGARSREICSRTAAALVTTVGHLLMYTSAWRTAVATARRRPQARITTSVRRYGCDVNASRNRIRSLSNISPIGSSQINWRLRRHSAVVRLHICNCVHDAKCCPIWQIGRIKSRGVA